MRRVDCGELRLIVKSRRTAMTSGCRQARIEKVERSGVFLVKSCNVEYRK